MGFAWAGLSGGASVAYSRRHFWCAVAESFRMTPSVTQRAAVSTLLMGAACSPGYAAETLDPNTYMVNRTDSGTLQEITVTAQRLELLGNASTASEGVVEDQELQLAPRYRPGQLLETVPGLIVTLHSGEGKANQYLLRGYNLDHGTDLATYVDGMPVNQPTHAHGQGYTDLNFLIPELADEISYTKGPYYANVGDFGAVGSVRVGYRDTIPDQVSATVGTLGFQRFFAAGSQRLGGGQLLAAAEVQHYDGPFITPDDARKENLVLRYSEGDGTNGYSVTGHVSITSSGPTPPTFQCAPSPKVWCRIASARSIRPTAAARSARACHSTTMRRSVTGNSRPARFFIYNQLHLFNDFTHFLIDPVHGDQEDQFENRRAFGGAADYTLPVPLGSIRNEVSVGVLTRYDMLDVGRLPSEDRVPLPARMIRRPSPMTTRCTCLPARPRCRRPPAGAPTFRSVLGFRDDYQHGTDIDYLAALHEESAQATPDTPTAARPSSRCFSPRAVSSTPRRTLEFYLSAGRGFHSADLRGVNQDTSVDLGLPHTPLLARQEGQEVGVRATPRRNLAFTFAFYNLWQQSETIIDPDVGQDTAGPPSRRYGYEINVTYQINRWLEFYGSYSGDHTHFTHPFDDGTGHLGEYITDAPLATGALALYLTNLGPVERWPGLPLSRQLPFVLRALREFGGGARFPGRLVRQFSDGHHARAGEWQGVRRMEPRCSLCVPQRAGARSIGIYNLLNTHAAAAEFWYVDRLYGEKAAGVADVHNHPLEPLMARFTVTKKF